MVDLLAEGRKLRAFSSNLCQPTKRKDSMKIVKFKDGRYGVRKFELFMGWQYLSLTEDFWWPIRYAHKYCAGTLKEAQQAMNRDRNFDFGKPVCCKCGINHQ